MEGSVTIEGVGQFRERLRRWLAETKLPTIPADDDLRFAALRAWQAQLHAAGWLGTDWPVAVGGRGLTPLHQAAVLQELVRAGAPLPVARGNLDTAGPTLVEWGTDEQKKRYLPKLLSAEEIWCQGFSEPGAGSDLASLKTNAELRGDHFIVDGHKIWTSQAHRADRCLLIARTDAERPRYRNLSLLAVDMRLPGITIRPIRQITGHAEFNEVFFDHVAVPANELIGPLHDGWNVAMHTLSGERGRILLLRSADAEAAFRALLAALRSHVSRTGSELAPETISRLGSVRTKLAVLEAQVRKTAARMARGDAPGPLDSVDRLVLTEIEQEVSGLAFDLLGPYRMGGGSSSLGLDVERTIYGYLYGRSYTISGGTTQVQLNVVAERMLGLPRT